MSLLLGAMYLRKSRVDLEAEARGEGETLARHEKTLVELAQARGIIITGTYREIVSGDTISDRPEMQRLLSAVERGEYDAVLCMDIDRLGRGDGADQSVILKTFKYSNTIIVTPYKTYNTRMETDEEYMEFSQFMSRGELKRIKRRMWAGRVASAKDGKWQGKVPFGYRRVRLETSRGWTLVPHDAEAEAVRSIYQWYGHDGVGKDTIARRISDMGFVTADGKPFRTWSVTSILTNPVYIGKVRWAKRRKRIEMRDGEEVVTRPVSDECVIADGLHPAIVSDEAWAAVQKRLENHKDTPLMHALPMRNPLSGLLVCAECGHALSYIPEYHRKVEATFRCRTVGCATTGIDVGCVYDILLKTLRDWVRIEPAALPDQAEKNPNAGLYAAALSQRDQLKAQLSRLQDLLETGIYSAETYIERSKIINVRISAADSEISRLRAELDKSREADLSALRPQIQHILDTWNDSTPAEKNRLLKSVIRKIVYRKTVRCFRNQNPADYLSLDIYPIL